MIARMNRYSRVWNLDGSDVLITTTPAGQRAGKMGQHRQSVQLKPLQFRAAANGGKTVGAGCADSASCTFDLYELLLPHASEAE
jgi:hypothetical protein